MIIVWFYSELGLAAAFVLLLGTASSVWLTLFGKSLWWSTWAFYLPMILFLYLLRKESQQQIEYSYRFLFVIAFIGAFIKCLFNGYEFISTTLVMMVCPFIYYAAKNSWPIIQLFKKLIITSLGSIIAVLTSFMILAYQISVVKPGVDIKYGLRYILGRYDVRTSEAAAVVGHSGFNWSYNLSDILKHYIGSIAINLNHYVTITDNAETSSVHGILQISMKELIVFFAIVSMIAFIMKFTIKNNIFNYKNMIALVCATWFSILAPLSWFIVFKGHAAFHPFDAITWYMPFTLFGFALSGVVIYQLLLITRQHISQSP